MHGSLSGRLLCWGIVVQVGGTNRPDGTIFVSLAFLIFLFVSSDSQIIFDLDRVASSSKE